MARRLAHRIDRRKCSHQVGDAEKIIPITHETAEIIAQQKKSFREQFGREPVLDDPLFFDPGVAAPQFLSDESTSANVYDSGFVNGDCFDTTASAGIAKTG